LLRGGAAKKNAEKLFVRAGSRPQRLKASTENRPLIAAVDRCATPKIKLKVEFFSTL